MILPHIAELDDQAAAMSKASIGQLRGRYSLEALGSRLNVPKVGADIENWTEWTPEIQERCVGDVQLTIALWRFLQPGGQDPRAVELEHRVSTICNQITTDGMPFDVESAEQLCAHWKAKRDAGEVELRKRFPGTTNFNSRPQISQVLEALGWEPEKRTEKTGQPCINDEVLEALPAFYPECAGLAEHYILGRRLGQLANGRQALLNNIGADGRIHGGLIHIGTPHSRAKHLQPNIAQVPSHKKGAPFAAEFRALFRPAGGWVVVTCDQADLQDRGFAHDLAGYDGGAYAHTFANGIDQHWQTAIALGLIPEDMQRDKSCKVHAAIREGAKTFRYAFLFGAGGERLGHIIGDTVRTVQHLDPSSDLPMRIFNGKTPSEAVLKLVGKNALTRFLTATPGLVRLRDSLKAQFKRHGWLSGLDGRRVPGGAEWKTLNRIVTSAEAIICKRWLIDVYDELHERFVYGWDGDVVIAAWIHDELVCCCRAEIAEQIGEIMVRHAKEAGEYYKFNVPLDAEFKIGRDWAGNAVNGAEALGAPMPGITVAPIEGAHRDHGADGTDELDEDDEEDGEDEARFELGEEEPAMRSASPSSSPPASDAGDADVGAPELNPVDKRKAPKAPPQHQDDGDDDDDDDDDDDAEHKEAPASEAPRGNGQARRDDGRNDDALNGNYGDREAEQHAGEPYGPIKRRLLEQGYQVAQSFPYTLPGSEAAALFRGPL